jgi:hypothetical protein
MRKPLLLRLTCGTLLLFAGCAPGATAPATFEARFRTAVPGMTKTEVRAVLGAPARQKLDVLPEGPFFGPQEGIDPASLNAEREYDQWQYDDGDTIFLIWFADPKLPEESWPVIGTTSYPKGAVF